MKILAIVIFLISCSSPFEDPTLGDHILTIKTYNVGYEKEHNKKMYIKINDNVFLQENLASKEREHTYRVYHKGIIDSIRIYKACLEVKGRALEGLWTIKLGNVDLGTERVLENKFKAKAIEFFYKRNDSF